ncbi:DNA primase small subunit [Brevipalpus obovatus]|uniref:DNA primase small subunit n=1 Tax=Brevipalpus obovatus TaxID=246614 RepID=UPI003D9E5ABE
MALSLYYRKLFPSNLFYKWLSYGDQEYFERREFSFTLPGDIYIRYQSFSSAKEFHDSLVENNPIKMDIGAVFQENPKDMKKRFITPQALERELVFDIDMDDYDEVRTCCSGPAICNLCWKFILIGVEILDVALRDDFGFKNIIWVFSGRRGIHGWVADKKARQLPPKARDAIVSYLTLIKGGNNVKRVDLGIENLHQMVSRSIGIVEKHFENILNDQKWLESDESLQFFINLCGEKTLREELRKGITKKKPIERWRQYLRIVESFIKSKKFKTSVHHLISEIKLQMCFPRLDAHVSRGINHLLKAPFCIHPKTGKVCVPIDVKDLGNFDLEKVPSLAEIFSQIDKSSSSESEEIYQSTPLLKYINIFKDFIKGCEKETITIKREEQENNFTF